MPIHYVFMFMTGNKYRKIPLILALGLYNFVRDFEGAYILGGL